MTEVVDISLVILIPACDSSILAFRMMYSAYKWAKQGDNIQLCHTPFPVEPVHRSMFSSNSCFLSHIQVSQETSMVSWYSSHLNNYPQLVVIHRVKGFSVVNEAEVDVILEFFCFFCDPAMLAIWSLIRQPFLNPARTSGSSWFTYCWRLAWEVLSITLLACEMSVIG